MANAGNGVVIDIDKWESYKDNSGSTAIDISVTRIDGSTYTYKVPDGYTEFEHSIKPEGSNQRSFTILAVKYGNYGNISSIQKTPKVTSLSVYYWTHSPGKTNPLLIKFVKADSSTELVWYENKSTKDESNTNWKKIESPLDISNLSTQAGLESKLDIINCEMNNVVQIDIGRTAEVPYCHSEQAQKRIKITHEKSQSFEGLTAYVHSTNMDKYSEDSTFTISDFTNGITQTGFDTPIYHVTKVVAFLHGNSPLLVYILPQKDWYRRNSSLENQKAWGKVEKLKDMDPSNQNDDICKILETLGILRGVCSKSENKGTMVTEGTIDYLHASTNGHPQGQNIVGYGTDGYSSPSRASTSGPGGTYSGHTQSTVGVGSSNGTSSSTSGAITPTSDSKNPSKSLKKDEGMGYLYLLLLLPTCVLFCLVIYLAFSRFCVRMT
ncbi:hypothetical protein BEWA_040020 [Theileria equi strain WA]|uniref:Uncharacterized protein n=1 Tax=Theileria equi strain WA TaxID=1537102 RepID=L1LFA9_THEEQ|nr:hypothetical protein BEWA_040020 [Theileria equi strain WA]EKX73964.1 hypothetical protein BEWA_040020 [Theileria equi strain WA]|eukprot:XP_004833416.1 hypothetical protein BEWA_040020 [Theileria equi strain WA]